MSIKDATDIPSWQVGFEDGIKFVLNNFKVEYINRDECNHFWRQKPFTPHMKFCVYCTKEEEA